MKVADSSEADLARGEQRASDPLEAGVLQRLLATRTLGRNLRVEARTASTNDIAKRLARDGAPDGTLVLADEQHRGRGRQGRSFSSPVGVGIYMSLLLRPRVPVSRLPQLTLVAGVAVAEAIEEVGSVPVDLKWPNDIMIRRKKAGGILTESVLQPDQSPVAVVGIGINVNTTLEQFPTALRERVTSLALAAGRFVPRLPTVAAVLGHFEPLYDTFQQSGLAPILPRWLRFGRVAGKRVRCSTEHGVEEGVALGVDEHGALLVRTAGNPRYRVLSGDVVFP